MSVPSVLIVEDEGLVALELVDRLGRMGYAASGIAQTADDAMALIASSKPDIILMDIHLRGPVDGVEAARRIRDAYGLPVIFLTAHGDAATVERATDVEPFGYVLKPFDGPALRVALTTALLRLESERQRCLAVEHLEAAEARERSVRERLQLVLDESPAIVYAGPATPERRLSFVSGRIAGLLGADREVVIGDPAFLSARIHPDDQEGARQAWAAAMETGRLVTEYRLRHEGGAYRWIRDEAVFVRRRPEDPREVVGFLTDVTNQRRAEREAIRSQRLAAVGAFMTGLAHEIRNPLFAISAAVDALEQEGVDRSFPGYAAVLRSEVRRLADLMTELMEYGRPSPPRLAREQIGAIVREARTLCLREAQLRKVEVESREVGTPIVFCERSRLVLVLRNLVENAIQHAPPGTIVAVSTTREADTVVCRVRDEGSGFQHEDIPSVFELFFTRRRGGTGLGLSIALRIAEEHGGTLTAENAPGGGALLTLRLPLAGDDGENVVQVVRGTAP